MSDSEEFFEADESNVRRQRALKVPAGMFVITSMLMAVDAIADLAAGSTEWHVGLEVFLSLLAAFGSFLLFRELQFERRRLSQQARQLQAASAAARKWEDAAAAWRGRYEGTLRGLGAAIEEQFAAWELTPAEREVCLLLLKGLSFKEIAACRHASERTVRQQANAAYKKAHLSGRAELSAFFLEDLLLPQRPVGDVSADTQAPAAAAPAA